LNCFLTSENRLQIFFVFDFFTSSAVSSKDFCSTGFTFW
jgi:hypothetical protein